jgi:hypothetical protein
MKNNKFSGVIYMLMQRGRFLVNNIEEFNNLKPDNKDGVKRVIDLDYMGKVEYEGNTIPILRMLLGLYKDEYRFYRLNIFNQNNEQMIIYMNIEDKTDEIKNMETAHKIVLRDIERNYSLYEHKKHTNESITNFWWDIEYNYMIFFGKEKIDIINYFLDSCFVRDGGREEVVKKLTMAGVRIK